MPFQVNKQGATSLRDRLARGRSRDCVRKQLDAFLFLETHHVFSGDVDSPEQSTLTVRAVMIRVSKMAVANVLEKTELLHNLAGFVKVVERRYTLTVSQFLTLGASTTTGKNAGPP